MDLKCVHIHVKVRAEPHHEAVCVSDSGGVHFIITVTAGLPCRDVFTWSVVCSLTASGVT